MAQTVANLKMIFGADTSGIEKGAKTAKQSIKDFDNTVQGATDSIAGFFGVDTAAIDKMTSSLRGLGENLKTSANQGVASFGKLLSSINAATAAIAGLGIGAAVAAFKLLNDEAENFKSTVAGANIEMATATYVSTYSQILHDMNAATGESVANFEANFKKAAGRIGSNLKNSIVQYLTSDKISWKDMLGVVSPFVQTTREQRQTARTGAETAEAAQQKIFDLQLKAKENAVEWAKQEARIAELQTDIRDKSMSVAERTQAIAEANALIEKRYGQELELRKQIAEQQGIIHDQAADSLPDYEKLLQYQRDEYDVTSRMESMKRSIIRTQNSLTAEAQKEAEARRKAAAALQAEVDAMADLTIEKNATGIFADMSVSQSSLDALSGQIGKAVQSHPIELPVRPVVEPEAIEQLTLDLTSQIAPAIESVSSSLGGLVGDLLTGGDAASNFTDSILSGFADMAIAVGKIAIAEGVAVSGIKAALESLNPAVAIAAGAALVALGSAVKAGLSNVAAGNYSSASTSLSTAGASSYGSSGMAQSTLKVEVVGRLKASGSDLISVIDSENYRRNQTT